MAHHHHGHGHAHKCADDVGELYSLFNHIHTDHVACLNEKVVGSAKTIFKPWDKRLDRANFVASDADEELIIHVPFTGVVKLKNFMIIGGPQGSSPSKVKLFVNREDIDFENVEDIKPTQEFELAENPNGDLEYNVNAAKFLNLSSITFFFPSNFGAESTEIFYIGMKGDFLHAKREPIITSYELKPNPATNKGMAEQMGAFRPVQ